MRIRSESDGQQSGAFVGTGRRLLGAFQRIWKNPSPINHPSSPDGEQSLENLINEMDKFEPLVKNKCFHEASLLLAKRENHLFEEIRKEDSLKQSVEEFDKLSADHQVLENSVLETVQQSLSLSLQDMMGEANGSSLTAALTSAVNAIYQMEEQDHQWSHITTRSPSNWKKLHDSKLRALVENRMDTSTVGPTGREERSSLHSDIHSMGRQMKEDLLLVVGVLRKCYPPQADICQLYASLYHQTFSARLKKIADFCLDDNDCTFLLRWVNEYYPGIFKKAELACEINSSALGNLLPKDLLEPLEEQYRNTQKDNLATYMNRVLEKEKQKWSEGHEPSGDEGCDSNPLAYDIIQFINGMVTAGEVILGNRDKAQTITQPLTDLLQNFKEFQEDIIKQNKANSKAYIKANLGNIAQLRDVLLKKSNLFPEELKETCLLVLTNMKQSAHSFFLNPVHKLLKPQYQKLGTSDWLKKNVFEQLLKSIEAELWELQALPQTSQQELIGQFHEEVTQEYVKRLLRREVKLKDKEQQQAACRQVMDNAKSLHKLFTRMGSKEDWLKEILIRIAEVLELQEVPTIQMQIVSLATTYPDLSEKHVSALLKLKTNFSKSMRKAVKETLSCTLEETCTKADCRPFFSKVQVR